MAVIKALEGASGGKEITRIKRRGTKRDVEGSDLEACILKLSHLFTCACIC